MMWLDEIVQSVFRTGGDEALGIGRSTEDP